MFQALCFLSRHLLMHLLSRSHLFHCMFLSLLFLGFFLLRLYELLNHSGFGNMLIILMIKQLLGLHLFIFGKTHIMFYLLSMSVFIHIDFLFLFLLLRLMQQCQLSFLFHFNFLSHLLFHLVFHISSSLRNDFASFSSCLLDFLKGSVFLLFQ